MDIISRYLTWHFVYITKQILRGWKNSLVFNLDYFSIPILLKTFFWHWHKYYYPYGKKIDFSRYAEAFVFNSMSRIIGAILRFFFIIIGILIEIPILLIGFAVLICWIFLPIILLTLLFFVVLLFR